jgi:hypothetical protein
MSVNPVPRITPEKYLELDRAAEFKSEYVNGEMSARLSGDANANRAFPTGESELRAKALFSIPM